MAYNNVNNLAEDFFKSIDIIVTERLQNVSYDSTIICTIIDDSNSKNGVYTVSNDSIKFDAKCENQTYKNGDQVRVTILNGDMTQDKYIVGKYVVDNNIKPISFVSPLEQIMDMTGNLIPKETADATYGLPANGDQTVREIWKLDLTKASAQSVNLSASDIFDTVYLSADFKSLLSNSNVKSGNYGLALTLLLELNDGTYASKVVKLDSSMMFGNPYAFSIYSQQQIKFDIASLGKVSALHLSLYQDKNFKTFANEDLVPAVLGGVQTDTLLVKNIAVGFGSDLSKLDDNTLKLYTTDSLLYRNEKTSSVDNRKHLRFAWYNKDENNKYLGFSDGVYVKDEIYDEQTYLEQVNAQKRLQAQQNSDVPNDENALRIAAEIKEIKPIIENFAATTSKELNILLTSFSERMKQLPGAIDLFTQELDNKNGIIITVSKASEAIKTGINNLYDYYMAVLKYASQFNKLPDTVGETEAKPIEDPPTQVGDAAPSFATIETSKDIIFNAKEFLLTELQKIITGDENKSYPEFQSDYDLYVQRITKQFEVLTKYWEQIDTIWTDDNDTLIQQKYAQKSEDLYEYNPATIDPQENKYCIYWYRYDPKAEGDMFMDKGWQRLLYKTPEDEFKDPPVVTKNIGLPGEDPDNLGYLKVSADLAEATVEVDLNAETMPEERFQVVLFYNHEIYKSNELVFTNESQITDSNLASLNDYITIKHGDKSQDVYQDYTITNTLLNAAERYYPRKLYIDFTLSDGTLANSQLAKSQIYWYIPNRSTMLSYDLEDLKKLNEDNNFLNDSVINKDGGNEIHSEHYRPNYTCFYKTIAPTATDEMPEEAINALIAKDLFFSYRIKDYYSPAFSQNMIQCKIVKDDKVYEAELLFTFASYGTSGTDYTLCISPAGRQAAITPENNTASKAWRVNVALYNGKNEEVPITACTATIQHQGANAAVQSPIEIKDPNTNAIIGYNLIYNNSSVNIPYCGILQLTDIPVVYNNMDMKLTGYFPIPYAANKEYFMEGANSIIYNSAGIDPKYYRDAYVLYDQTAEAPVNGEWSAAYIHREGVGAQFSDEDKVDYAFLPTIVEKKLLPCNMYVDTRTEDESGKLRSWSDWMPYAVCQQNGVILWATPILIIQNRYPSAMLNAWDGSLQIDETNGTIMSTMMGAGRKTKNNTFEGVLMGDIKTGARIEEESPFNYDNKTGMGIYGFNDGAQSFGFNIDGTAFIGKSGRGRILMDGNKGQISSASYQATRLLDGKPDQQPTKDTDLISGFTQAAGMMIDLDDGIIDIRGTAIEEEKDENDAPTGNTKYVVEDLKYVNKDSEEQPTDPNIGEIKVEKDENDNPIIPQQSHIRIDAKSPYFTITSIQGKDLVSIGNKGYFIQSDNYIPFEFKENTDTSTEEQEEELTDGYGMKIDLHQGSIDAYNLKITSKTFFVNSRKDATVNFIVRDPSTNKNLINMGILQPNEDGKYPTEDDKVKDIWYLQSGNYTIAEFDENNKLKENTGSGMKIDLGTGQIDAYNFKLTSKNVFIDSTKDAKAIFAVKDNNDKYLVYLGVQPEGQTDLSNIWYFQSSNYISQADSTEEAAAAGMKIDLGTGLIDAYNFKFTSKNVFIDSTENATTYFEIKADNKDTSSTELDTIFKVNDNGATLAGWTVDNNSIRTGTLGADRSLWLCREGTISLAAEGFVGNEFDDLGVEERTKEWCLTIGQNFGVNSQGKLFARGVAILGGELRLGENLNNPTTILDSEGNLNINNKFKVNNQGYVEALSGQIGENIASGMIFIHGQDYGDTTDGAGSVFFVRDDATDDDTILNRIGLMVGNVSTNNFYLGNGGLILRSEGPLIQQYKGVRLSGDGLYVDGCRNNSSNSWGHRSWLSGDGLTFYSGSNIFEGYEGVERGFIGIKRQTNEKDELKFNAPSLGVQIDSGAYINIDAPKINLASGDTSIENLVEINGKNAITWISEIDTLINLINGGKSGSVKIITSVGNEWKTATATGSGVAMVDNKIGTCSVSITYNYLQATSSFQTITVEKGIITNIS